MKKKIPSGYIFKSKPSEFLEQGDIIHFNDELKNEFLSHFNIKYDLEFLMVTSQTCDLVKERPKVNHINLCILRPLANFLKREVDNLKPKQIDDTNIIKLNDYNALRNKIYDLINNANTKAHLYLPCKQPLHSEMIAVLNFSYPLRVEHYDLIATNKILSLKKDYQAKLGSLLSTLYNRVAATELVEYSSWNKKELLKSIDYKLQSEKIIGISPEAKKELDSITLFHGQDIIKLVQSLEDDVTTRKDRQELVDAYKKLKPFLINEIEEIKKVKNFDSLNSTQIIANLKTRFNNLLKDI